MITVTKIINEVTFRFRFQQTPQAAAGTAKLPITQITQITQK